MFDAHVPEISLQAKNSKQCIVFEFIETVFSDGHKCLVQSLRTLNALKLTADMSTRAILTSTLFASVQVAA